MKLDEKKILSEFISKGVDDYLLEDKDSLFQIIDEFSLDIYMQDDDYDEKIVNITDITYSEIEEQREKNPSKFETLFQESYKSALNKSDIDIYVNFCILLGYDAPINVWHIEQNLLKNYTNGKQTIRELCYSAYCDYGV